MSWRAVGIVAVAVAGCGGGNLRAESSSIDGVISRARTAGAQSCAPVQLAMAEAHNDFAQQELSEGNYYQARAELEVARKNADDALRLSPRERCAVAKGPGDTDGDGIPDDRDQCPREPEDADQFKDKDGCPDRDNDSDGLADNVDACPNEPEDKDGFTDEDGCPDLDNDDDGFADKIDQCPNEAEDKDGKEDDDGCPDCDEDGDGVPECPEAIDKCPDKPNKTPDGCPAYNLVTVTQDKIEIKQTIFFDTAKASIKRVSYPLLNEVAQALVDNPTIRVRIEGHTDSKGSDRKNLKLSRARAASVRKYLVQRGIDSSRLVSEGYGERVPISENRTKAGREQNRRVEFVITSR